MTEPVIARERIAEEARTAAAVQGAGARNPYPEFTAAHAEWAACFDAALRSDVLEGSEA